MTKKLKLLVFIFALLAFTCLLLTAIESKAKAASTLNYSQITYTYSYHGAVNFAKDPGKTIKEGVKNFLKDPLRNNYPAPLQFETTLNT